MMRFFIFFTLLIFVVKSELSLEQIDAVADLSAIAVKYFSQWPHMKYKHPEDQVMSAFAWSVIEMWEENESSLYALTRLANLVDEVDGNTGELSVTARVIRSFAEESESRKVYFTTTAGGEYEKDSKWKMNSSSASKGVAEGLEQMYMKGEGREADIKVNQLIKTRWNSLEKAISDIENAGRKGYPNLMTALIRLGSNHRTLKFIAPELKAGMSIKLLSLADMKLTPLATKWLLTMETYREDQLKLVKLIEKSLKQRQIEKTTAQTRTANDLVQLFAELEEAAAHGRNFDNEKGADGWEHLHKTLQKTEEPVGAFEEPQKTIEQVKDQKQTENTNTEVLQTPQAQEQSVQVQEQSVQIQESPLNKKSYFEEQEEREDRIDQIISENKPEQTFDNDGIYDSEEQANDRAGQITALILIIVIIISALGVYLYLRRRRNIRNRTMLVVNGALEQSTIA